MRLGDLDALLDKFLRSYTEQEKVGNFQFVACEIKQGFADMVCEQPTIDAVPVVRCKDCKRYFGGDGLRFGTCQILSERSDRLILGHQVKMPPDGFCYLGKQKDGDSNA